MKKQSCVHVVMRLMLPLLLMQGLNGCIERERDALLESKNSFIIDKLDLGLSSWSGKNCCDWTGVDCNRIGHVVSLVISGLLGGEINPSLLNLKYLESMYLSDNMLSGTIPSNIGSLKHLTHINLYRNNFIGPIPTSIRLLSNLEFLDVSLNHLTGTIPTSIGLLSNLKWLDVSQNHLAGPIPTSIRLLSKLGKLDVSVNSLTGTVLELHFANLANLTLLDMSSNKLTMNVSHQWVPPFQLTDLNIQSCIVGPEFPSWLQTQTSLFTLNLSSTGILGTMPGWFEEILSTINRFDLSKNEIRGKLPEIHASNMYVNLGFNKFESLFKQFPTHLKFIDVSNNLLSGQFPPNCYGPRVQYGPNYFIFSNNNLSGPLPDYLCSLNPGAVDLSSNKLSGVLNSCFGKTFEFLDLSNNSLTGQIPSDFGNWSGGLLSLYLSNNRFHGKLPSSLQYFNRLRTLDLSKNAFTGFLPQWLPELTFLQIANLQSNKFYGEIPEMLCKLEHLHLLHLGQNNITGRIPPCFGQFTAMTTNDSLGDPFQSYPNRNTDYSFEDNIEVYIRGFQLRYTSSLPYLISMDLSSNIIVGNIPTELTDLLELKNLNLSGNRLEGNIPMRLGNLKNVESLDLSRNKLSGAIPSTLSLLTFLSHLNLSFNNLSGKIPTGNQLQTLDDPSIYMGNNQLCGKPLEQRCSGDVNESSGHTSVHSPHEEEDDSYRLWFYAGIGPGFVVGFVGFCSVLYFKNSWRHSFFWFFENGWNWLYVQIAVTASLLQKKFQKR